jgi:HK97 family phage prohead protease
VADTKAPYGDVPYGDPGYLDADGNQASKSGKPGVKRYPLTADKVMAAWSYINQERNAGQYTAEQLSAIKGRIKAAMSKHGHDVSSDSSSNGASRSELMRDYPLEDLHIVRSGDGGDGRTMEAFAAVFNTETEIKDHEGHYLEVIEPVAFNKRLADLKRSRPGVGQVKVMFNHGLGLDGTPEPRFMMPVATPVSIEATSRGLLTRSRFNETPLGEEVLELVRSGSVTSMSFTGRIVRSDPQLPRHGRHRPDSSGRLTTVHRTELGLRELGPVLFAAYEQAEILGVRMSTPGTWEPDDDQHDTGTPPDDGAAAGEPLGEDQHSARYHENALYRLRSQELRERVGLTW